jgi:hypothetical protein
MECVFLFLHICYFLKQFKSESNQKRSHVNNNKPLFNIKQKQKAFLLFQNIHTHITEKVVNSLSFRDEGKKILSIICRRFIFHCIALSRKERICYLCEFC